MGKLANDFDAGIFYRGVSGCALEGSMLCMRGSLALRARGESNFVRGEFRAHPQGECYAKTME